MNRAKLLLDRRVAHYPPRRDFHLRERIPQMDKKVYSQLAEGFELLAAGYRSLAQEGAEATPTAAPEPKKPITIEQVRAAMSAKSDEGKTAQVKALLMKYDAGRLSGVKPEDYADLLREVEAL